MASRILLDGEDYGELPSVDSLTMDETIMVERYAGVGLEQMEDSLPMGAIKALVVIAVKRVKPEIRESEIADRIGKIKLKDLDSVVQQEADESPPDESSPSESAEQLEPSGEAGTADTWPGQEPNGASSSGLPSSPTGLISGRKTLAP